MISETWRLADSHARCSLLTLMPPLQVTDTELGCSLASHTRGYHMAKTIDKELYAII